MTILLHISLPCELAAGPMCLRLLFIWLFLLSWVAYWQVYPWGGAQDTPVVRASLSWRMRPRTPEACEGCQKGLKVQIFRPRTDVVPYAQTKNPCGRRKTLNTAGHACPNPACAYFAVTAAHLHAVVGNGKRGQRKDIQCWKCQACEKKFTSRLHTPLYRLKTDLE